MKKSLMITLMLFSLVLISGCELTGKASWQVEGVNNITHLIEGENIKLGEYISTPIRTLKLTLIGEGTSVSDETKFEDVSTEETFDFSTGTDNQALTIIGGIDYYVKVFNAGTADAYVMLTWGTGASYGDVGSETFRVHIVEGENIKLKEYTSIPNRILKLTLIGSGTILSDEIIFEDVDTGEEFHFATGIDNQASSIIASETYYVKVNAPEDNGNVTLTWGTGASYGDVGDETSLFLIKRGMRYCEPTCNIYTPKKECGSDDCGGSCGTCPSDRICLGGLCRKCIDSDGSKDYYTKGYVNSSYLSGSENIYDKCLENRVLEAYCREDGGFSTGYYLCPNGCQNGACINETIITNESEEVEEEINMTCTDSDGGKDYYVKGVISGIDTEGTEYEKEDYCDSNFLIEYYCELNNESSSEFLNCTLGCEDGACLGIGEEGEVIPVTEVMAGEEAEKEGIGVKEVEKETFITQTIKEIPLWLWVVLGLGGILIVILVIILLGRKTREIKEKMQSQEETDEWAT